MTSKPRLLAPDLARGIMLLLIAMAYAGIYVSAGFGTDVSALSGPDRVAAAATTILLDNRAFPLFALLFGCGLAWSVRSARDKGVEERLIRARLRRRALVLLLFGAVHSMLVFPGEILMAYGLATLLVGWLLFRSRTVLVRAAVILTGVYLLTIPPGMIAIAGQSSGDDLAVPGYATLGDWLLRILGVPMAPIFTAVAYPLLLLVVLGFLIGRSGLIEEGSNARLRALAGGGIAISVIGALPAAAIALGVIDPGTLPTAFCFALQVLTGVLGGVGYLALLTLLARRVQDHPGMISRAVAAVGRRSLTFYLLNSVLVAVILHPDLIGLGTHLGPLGALGVAAGVWLLGLPLAARWERAGRAGPADALMRRMVDGSRPPAHERTGRG